ncbi:MAG: Bax inhibitor-1 family protein [Candidatus Babeliales bacterium]
MEQYTCVSGKQVYKARFMAGVFAWMAGALALTSFVSYCIAHIPFMFTFLIRLNPYNAIFFWGQFLLGCSLSSFIYVLPFSWVAGFYTFYSAMMGVTFSFFLMNKPGSIYVLHDMYTIVVGFLPCIPMFLALAFFGYCAKRDFSVYYTVVAMLYIGFLGIGLTVLFYGLNEFATGLAILFVGAFAFLISQDMQPFKEWGEQVVNDDGEGYARATMIAALIIYSRIMMVFVYLCFMFRRRR